MSNASIGLGNKLDQQIDDRIRLARVDYDFYSNGFPVQGIENKSANHLFGNGKWKSTVKNALGEEVFNKYADVYGNKPVDFQLAAIKTEYSSYFLPNEKVAIKDKNGVTTPAKVLDVQDKQFILIMQPFILGTQWNSGTIINVSRADGAKKAMDRFTQMNTDAKPDVVNNQPTTQNSLPAKAPVIIETKTNDATPNNNKKIVCFLLIIAAILIGATVYKQLNKSKN